VNFQEGNYETPNSLNSIREIREEIDNLHVLLDYFEHAFNPNAFDSAIKLKCDFFERELLKEFKSKDPDTKELIKRLSISQAYAEKGNFNYGRLKIFIGILEKRIQGLVVTMANKAKGGRKTNDLMFDIAYFNVNSFRQVHNGKYPSAMWLSKSASDEAETLFESLKAGEHKSIPTNFRNEFLTELQKRDEKLKKNGTKYLPVETARAYISRIKDEEIH